MIEKKTTNEFIDIILIYNQVSLYKYLLWFGSKLELEV
jgi:hypothetical protein